MGEKTLTVEAGGVTENAPEVGNSPGVIGELARMPGDTILTLDAVARIFGRSPKSIYRAIRRGELPPSCRLLGKASFTAGSILQHIQNRLERAARERIQRKVAELAP